MPEAGIDLSGGGKTDQSKFVLEAIEMDPFDFSMDYRELVEKYDQEVVGAGRESVVIPKKGQELEKVVAVSFAYDQLSPEEMKSVFYTQRLYEALFPHNFPHFYAASGGDNIRYASSSVRERIQINDNYDAEVKYPFSEVEKQCEELGLPLAIDHSPDNLAVSIDGGEYYLDVVMLGKENLNLIDEDKLLNFLESQNRSDKETKNAKRIIQTSMKRLHSLSRDAKFMFEEAA